MRVGTREWEHKAFSDLNINTQYKHGILSVSGVLLAD